MEYIDFDLDNAFDVVNVYRGPPTPEREEAWQNLSYSKLGQGNNGLLSIYLHTKEHAINIEKDKLHIYNRSDVPNLRPAPPEVGGYGAVLEVFHQLHCLVRF